MKRTPKERLTRAVKSLIMRSTEYSWREDSPQDLRYLTHQLKLAQAHYDKVVKEVFPNETQG